MLIKKNESELTKSSSRQFLISARVGGQVPDSLLSWNCRRSAISGCQCVPFGVLAKVMRNDE